MGPTMFRDGKSTKRVINGPSPPPLRISKESHAIHKPHQKPPTDAAAAGKSQGQSAAATRQPVIIYTHSPKVVYAKASDFMTIVQNLTGPRRRKSGDDKAAKSQEVSVKEEKSFSSEKDCSCGGTNNSETTSVLSDEVSFIGDVKQESTAVSPMYDMTNSFLVDATLFTPIPSELFCSARPTSLFQPPSTAATSMSAVSPSFMEFMNAFPGY